jgi:hypothetical protein
LVDLEGLNQGGELSRGFDALLREPRFFKIYIDSKIAALPARWQQVVEIGGDPVQVGRDLSVGTPIVKV